MFSKLVGEAFKEVDKDKSGFLDIDEVKPMCMSLIKKFSGSLKASEEEVMVEKLIKWFD